MNQLTNIQERVLNNISQVRDVNVKLGELIQDLIATTCEKGTPVNAKFAQVVLSVTGNSKHGETLTIGSDKYELLADEAQTKSNPTNIAVNIFEDTVQAFGTLTVDTQPTAGDTFTIGSKSYIFVPVGTDNGEGEVSIGADLAGAQAAIVAAINGTDEHNTPHPDVTAAAFDNDDCVITAKIGGTVGNNIDTTETFTANTNVFSGAKLASGADCSAADTVAALITAINTNDTQGIGATSGESNTITLKSDIAGATANNIIVAETFANAAFNGGATKLAGGVDGTITKGPKFMVDDTYLYICIDGNTKSQANWRRISLGSAY